MSAIYEMRKLGRLADIEILSPPLSVAPACIVFSQALESRARSRAYDEALRKFKKTAAFRC